MALKLTKDSIKANTKYDAYTLNSDGRQWIVQKGENAEPKVFDYPFAILLGDEYTDTMKHLEFPSNSEELYIHSTYSYDRWDLPEIVFCKTEKIAKEILDEINTDSYFFDKAGFDFDDDVIKSIDDKESYNIYNWFDPDDD